MGNIKQKWQLDFLHFHKLGESYLQFAESWIDNIIPQLLESRDDLSRPLLVAVNGCQGSGKSTLCEYLVSALAFKYQRRALSLSLDDFYLTHEERVQLSENVHPLLAVRGVPGTHDIDLLELTLDNLFTAKPVSVSSIPRFDKSTDDRKPKSEWDEVTGIFDVVFLEGWCLGAVPETIEILNKPINALEEHEDPDGVWRSFANRALKNDFLRLYDRIDLWLMLKAPSFDYVYQWRLEQEQKLVGTQHSNPGRGVMAPKEVARFIQFYERLTENCLRQLPDRVHYLYQLGENREVLNFQQRSVVNE